VLDREDFPVPFPLVRLHTEVAGTEAGELRDFRRGQKITAVQNGGLTFDQHSGLLAGRSRRSDVRQQEIDNLLQCFFLAVLNQLRQELHDLVNDALGRRPLFVVREGDRYGSPLQRTIELADDIAPGAAQHRGPNLLNLLSLRHYCLHWEHGSPN